jgi:hypothetical protein
MAICTRNAPSEREQHYILPCEATDSSDIAVALKKLVSTMLSDIGSPQHGAIRFDIDEEQGTIAATWHASAEAAIAAKAGMVRYGLKLDALQRKGIADAARGELNEFDYDCHLAIIEFVETRNSAAERSGEPDRYKFVVQWVRNLLPPFLETGE